MMDRGPTIGTLRRELFRKAGRHGLHHSCAANALNALCHAINEGNTPSPGAHLRRGVELLRVISEKFGSGSPGSMWRQSFARFAVLTLGNNATFERKAGRCEKALEYLQQAEAWTYDLPLDESSNIFLNLSAVLNDLKRHDEAEEAAKRAVRQTEAALLRLTDENVFPTEKVAELAIAYNNWAVQLEFTAGATQALPLYAKAVALADSYLDENDALRPCFKQSYDAVLLRVQQAEHGRDKSSVSRVPRPQKSLSERDPAHADDKAAVLSGSLSTPPLSRTSSVVEPLESTHAGGDSLCSLDHNACTSSNRHTPRVLSPLATHQPMTNAWAQDVHNKGQLRTTMPDGETAHVAEDGSVIEPSTAGRRPGIPRAPLRSATAGARTAALPTFSSSSKHSTPRCSVTECSRVPTTRSSLLCGTPRTSTPRTSTPRSAVSLLSSARLFPIKNLPPLRRREMRSPMQHKEKTLVSARRTRLADARQSAAALKIQCAWRHQYSRVQRHDVPTLHMPTLTPADTSRNTPQSAQHSRVTSCAGSEIRATRSHSVASPVRVFAWAVLTDVKMHSDTAVRRIQTAWRQVQRRRKIALMLTLQRKLNGRLLRKRNSAAVAIQCWWRIIRVRRLYAAVARIGAAWRAYQVRQGVAFCLRAIISIQRAWRARAIRRHALFGALCRIRCRKRLKVFQLLTRLVLRYQAATRLQSAYRAYAKRKEYRAYNNAVYCVQRAWSRYRAQCCKGRAVTRIQRIVRVFFARRQRINLRRTEQGAAIALQRWVRLRHTRHGFEHMRSAQRRIARWWKRRVLVRMHRLRAAECIQRAWHSYARDVLEPRRDYNRRRIHAATCIQTIWRMHAVQTRVNTAGVHILTTNDRRGPRGARAIVHVFRRVASKEWRMVAVTQTADGIESEELIFAEDEGADAGTHDAVCLIARRLVEGRAPQHSKKEDRAAKSESEHCETNAVNVERTNNTVQREFMIDACWEDLTPNGSEAVAGPKNEQDGRGGAHDPPVAAHAASPQENVDREVPIKESQEEKHQSMLEEQKKQPKLQAEKQPLRQPGQQKARENICAVPVGQGEEEKRENVVEEQKQQLKLHLKQQPPRQPEPQESREARHPQKENREPPGQQEQQVEQQQLKRHQELKTSVRDHTCPPRSKNSEQTPASRQRETVASNVFLSPSSCFSPSSSSSSLPSCPPLFSNPPLSFSPSAFRAARTLLFTDAGPATTAAGPPQTPPFPPRKEGPSLDSDQSPREAQITSTWMEFLNCPLVPAQETSVPVSARRAPSVTSEAIDEIMMGLEQLSGIDRGHASSFVPALSTAPAHELREDRDNPRHACDAAPAPERIPISTALWDSRQAHDARQSPFVEVPRADEGARHAEFRQREKRPHNDEEGGEPEPMEEPEDDTQSLSALMLCYLEPAAPVVQDIAPSVSARTSLLSPQCTREQLSRVQECAHVAAARAVKSIAPTIGELPWKCSECDFVNEVSPKQCVMCDSLRTCEVRHMVTPVERERSRLQRPQSACDIRMRPIKIPRGADGKKRHNFLSGRKERVLPTSRSAANLAAMLPRPRSALTRKPPVPRVARCSSSRLY